MSSDQFAEQPLPPEKKRCPHCGEIMLADAQMCWLCLEKFSVREGAGPLAAASVTVDKKMPSEQNVTLGFLGALTILLCGALAYEAPGILIVLAIAAVPAVVRTVVLSSKQESSGGSVIGTFLGSLGVAVLVGLAASIAFFATCFVVCAVGLSSVRRGGYDSILPASVGAGLVPGIAVAVGLFKRFWGKKG